MREVEAETSRFNHLAFAPFVAASIITGGGSSWDRNTESLTTDGDFDLHLYGFSRESAPKPEIPDLVENALAAADEDNDTRLNVVLWERNGKTALRFAKWNLVLEGLPLAKGETVVHGLTCFLLARTTSTEGTENEFWLGTEGELKTHFNQSSRGRSTSVMIVAKGPESEHNIQFEFLGRADRLIFPDGVYAADDSVQKIVVTRMDERGYSRMVTTRQTRPPHEA